MKKAIKVHIIMKVVTCVICLTLSAIAIILVNQFDSKVKYINAHPYAVSNAANKVNNYNFLMFINMMNLCRNDKNSEEINFIKNVMESDYDSLNSYYEYIVNNHVGNDLEIVELRSTLDNIYRKYNDILTHVESYTSFEMEEIIRYVDQNYNSKVSAITNNIIEDNENNINNIIEESKQTVIIFTVIIGFSTSILIIVTLHLYLIKRNKKLSDKYKEHLLAISGNAYSAFCIFDVKRSKIEYISGNIKEMIGIECNRALEDYTNLLNYLDRKLAEEIIELFEITLVNKIIERDLYFTNPKTRIQKWIKVKVYLAKGFPERKYIISFNDIDELKKQEILLKNSMINAQKANEAKTEFMSRMSHDIKNPLNGIIGIATLASTKTNIPEEMSDALAKILKSSKILLKILNNILDISKIENGKYVLHYEQFTIQEVIQDILAVLMPPANEKMIEVSVSNEFDMNKVLMGDALKLKQILFNLLSNSVKFTYDGGNVNMHICEVNTISEKYVSLKFTIQDTGIGITNDFLEKIYDPFEQENRDPYLKNDGSGLGMSIVKSLVYLLNGSIKVTSKVNVGSTFDVEIPFVLKNYAKFLEKTDQKMNQDIEYCGKRFLVVDDNELNLEIATEILKLTGAQVEGSLSGWQALEMFKASPSGYYDVIFMDIRMPDLNGYETAKIIRGLDHVDANTVAIIALSANAFSDDVSKAYECGMNLHLSKPININLLNKALLEIFHEGYGNGKEWFTL